MGSLLDALGLDPSRLPPATAADGRKVDLNLRKDYDPGASANKPKVDFKMPSDPKQQVDLFARAIEKAQDAVVRDKLVRGLRDQIAKIPQPFLEPGEVKKKIDEAIRSLIESKSKELLLKLIEAAVGQSAQRMPEVDAKPRYGPQVQEKDLGEKILRIDLPFPGDQPKKITRGHFEFRGLPKRAKAGSYVSFKLLTPHWFDPGKTPGSWVEAIRAEDHRRDGDAARSPLQGTHIEQTGELSLSLALPSDAGAWVIAIRIQSGLEGTPVEPIVLT